MCSEEQAEKQIKLLEKLVGINSEIVTNRPQEDQTYYISDTQSQWFLDYKNRKHIYVFSPNALTLNLNDIGTLSVAANTWTDVSFRPGMQIFTSGQATLVPVYVRSTDQTIAGASSGGGGGGAVTIADGADITLGAKAQGAVTNPAVSATAIQLLKGLLTEYLAGINVNNFPATQPVSGSVSVSNFPATQPVSGSVTANAGTNLNTSLLALESGGNLASLVTSMAELLTDTDNLATLATALSPYAYDNTHELKVSLYGTNATPGDSPIGINPSGNVKININGASAGVTFPSNAEVAPGATTAPSKEVLMGGKTNDGTPQYQPIPEGTGGRSLIVEGVSGGAAVNSAIQATAGTALVADQGNTELRISNYVTKTVAGDTALTLGSTTSANSLPVVVASDQGAVAVKQSGLWTIGPSSSITCISSAAYTSTQTQADQTNSAGKGVKVFLNVSSAGTGSITLEIDQKDALSGTYVAMLTGAAVTSNGLTVYTVYPTLAAAANSIAQDVLPTTWRVKVVANNANSITYSVGATVLA